MAMTERATCALCPLAVWRDSAGRWRHDKAGARACFDRLSSDPLAELQPQAAT